MSFWYTLNCQQAELEEKFRVKTEKKNKCFKQYIKQQACKEHIEKMLIFNQTYNHTKMLEEFNLQIEQIEKQIQKKFD